jgi:hypothetical protein
MLKKGDRVFFAENSSESGVVAGNYGAAFHQIAAVELGLHATFYMGANLAARQSSLSKEIRDDFYGAKVAVLYFGEPKDDSSFQDQWALAEIPNTKNHGIECLIYVSPTFPVDILRTAGYSGTLRVVHSKDEFCAALRADLTHRLQQ